MARAGAARVLVAGVGNVLAGDDGFGPEVARRLAGEPLPGGVRVADYGIRGLHLAYDLLDPWDALVLVDALPDRGAVGAVTLLELDDGSVRGTAGGDARAADARAVDAHAVDAHAMDPATVLDTLAALGGRLPPRTLLVGCQVAETGDGIGLSPPVAAAVDEALQVLRSVLTAELKAGEVA
jgi:hydrogenase maturation protease